MIGLLAVTAIPTVTGVGQAVSAQKRENAASKEQEKFHMTAIYDASSGQRETSYCVLRDKRLRVNLDQRQLQGHQFCGYYFTYPSEAKEKGLVSTISDEPPMLNWIMVNTETRAVEFGGRKETVGHVIGPWGWSDDEAFLTLRGRADCFVARWQHDDGGEGGGSWSIYWDPEGEMLAAEEDCVVVKLRRRPLLGMESRYVKH